MQTKASMVIPCYNKSEYIDAMFQSVYDQLYDNIELIIVNDGSTDDTLQKINMWKLKFEVRGFSVIVIDQKNMGVGFAVLEGLKSVTGEYVFMPDSDDLLEPHYVSRMAEILDKNSSVDWVFCNALLPLKKLNLTGRDILPLILFNTYNVWAVWSKAVRKTYMDKCKLIENFIAARFTQEPSVNLPLAIGGSMPYLLYENLYIYIKRESSIMRTAISTLSSLADFYDKYLALECEILKKYSVDSEENIKIANIGVKIPLKRIFEMMIIKEIAQSKFFPADVSTFLSEFEEPNLSINCLTSVLFENSEPTFSLFSDKQALAKIDIMLNGLPLTKGRVIVCGALSLTAHQLIPMLKQSMIKIDALWDASAYHTHHYEIPLYKPDYDSLDDDDIVIIAVNNRQIFDDIRKRIKRGMCIDSFDIKLKILLHRISYESNGGALR